MRLTKDLLDKRICDVETEASNTETYREFIHNSEKEFGLTETELDIDSDSNIDKYFKFLCGLWEK